MNHLSLQILLTLHNEHMAIISVLERLEALLEENGPDQPPLANDKNTGDILLELANIMEKEIGCHYAFEEEYLFPRFSQMASAGIPMMLKGEHDAIRPLAKLISGQALAAKTNGFDADSWRKFHALGRELVEREVFHVQKEEMGFLPGLQHMLDPNEDPALTAAHAKMKSGS